MTWLSLLTNKWVQRGALVLALIAAFLFYRSSLIEKGRDEVKADVSKKALKQIERAQEQTALWKAQANAADTKYQEAMDIIRGFGPSLAAIDSRMQQRTPSPVKLAGASKKAVDNYAAETDRDFADCRKRYAAMGETAATASAAAHALNDAWPAYQEFQDKLNLFQSQLKGTK